MDLEFLTSLSSVPRPLFIEEHGLRLLLESEGVGVELSRGCYERGEWADAVQEAYMRGMQAKAKKRQEGETGKRREEGRKMAEGLIDWLDRWKAGVRAMQSREIAQGKLHARETEAGQDIN